MRISAVSATAPAVTPATAAPEAVPTARVDALAAELLASIIGAREPGAPIVAATRDALAAELGRGLGDRPEGADGEDYAMFVHYARSQPDPAAAYASVVARFARLSRG
jgi:hypothetical protein